MSWDGRQAVFDSYGHPMSDEDCAENTELVWTIIEQAMKYSNDHSAEIPADRSLYDFFREKLKEMFPAQQKTHEEADRKQETVLQMAEMWGAFVGSPIQTQSLKYFWLEECIDGENLFVAETYYKILSKIAEPALRRTDIKFNTRVTKIVSLVGAPYPSVTVETERGEKMTFEEVVVTAPLGWLKRNTDAFVPKLPSRLEQAIDAISYGHLDKVSGYQYLPSLLLTK
jgi:hypothetical protein